MVHFNAIGRDTFNASIILIVLDTIAVLLRLLTRRFSKISYAADDYWALVAVLFAYAELGISIWAIVGGGGGSDITEIPLEQTSTLLKALYIALPFYVASITAVKISMLSLYWRLFGVKTAFRRAVHVLWILCAMWFLGVELGTLMQCLPPQGLWDFKVTCKYFNEELFFLTTELSNCLIDVAIIILPIQEIIKLQLPIRSKVFLSLIFMVGTFVVVTSIVRMKTLYNPSNVHVPVVKALFWTNLQMGIAIVCACLPTYRPLMTKAVEFTSRVRDEYGSLLLLRTSRRNKSSRSGDSLGRDNSGNNMGAYNNLNDPNEDVIHLTKITGASYQVDNESLSREPTVGTIGVQRLVEVV